MTDEPTKAAIERACEITGYSVPDYHWQVTEHPKKRTRLWNATNAVARHLDQVSETAINALSFVSQFNDEPADVCADALQALILPDPEPDVLAEAMQWAGVSQLAIDAVKHRLRGYAITPLKDTRNDR